MAATFNAFTALVGSQDALAAASKKKKKSNANKTKPAAEQAQATRPVPVSEPVAAVSDGPAVVPVGEAIAISERTARTYRSGADRIKLWKDWIKQATDRNAQAIKYKEADGSFIDFKEMYTRSRALIITVESCISSPLPAQNEGHLQQLLESFLPSGNTVSGQLANAIVRLGELLADDAPDTMGAAQRAVAAIVAALKSGYTGATCKEASQVTCWISRVSDISKEISSQQAFLQKLAQTSGGIITKEQTACAVKIVRLQAQKFDLLQPGSLPQATGASASNPTVKSVNELKSVISARIKAAEGQGSKASGAHTGAAAIKREEALLVQQEQELASQIKTLEAQLASLRSQAQEVSDRRVQIQQRQRTTFEAVKGKSASASAPGLLPTSHYKQQLAATSALAALVDPSTGNAGMDDVAQLVASQASVAVDYIMTAHQFLGMSLTQLAEIPQRVNFSKQRVAQAERLLKLSAASDKAVKQKVEAERLLEEAVGSADDILLASREVVNSVRTRYEQLGRTAPDQAAALQQHIRNIDEVAARIQSQYMSVQAVMQPSLAAPAAPAASPAPAPPAFGAGPALGNGTLATPSAFSQTILAAPAAAAAAVAPRAPALVAAAPAPLSKPGPIAKPNQKAPVPTSSADQVIAAPKAPGALAAPTPAAAPARQWAKVQVPAAALPATGDSAPTPAEAFMPAGSSADGFKAVGAKKNRRKA